MNHHIYYVGFSVLMGIAGMIDHRGSPLQGGLAILMWLAVIYGARWLIKLRS